MKSTAGHGTLVMDMQERLCATTTGMMEVRLEYELGGVDGPGRGRYCIKAEFWKVLKARVVEEMNEEIVYCRFQIEIEIILRDEMKMSCGLNLRMIEGFFCVDAANAEILLKSLRWLSFIFCQFWN